MSSLRFKRLGPVFAVLACLGILVSCGGGGEGEVGSGGTGAALGTVTGLGSVFVDGTRFDDSNAAVEVANLSDSPDAGEAKLGQRVAIEFETDGVAKKIHIEPEVVGIVTGTPTSAGFSVLGQNIVVNTQATVAPITQFDGGYTRLADVRAGDLVEIHGVRLASGVIQATRVENRLAPLPYLRVVGAVTGLQSVNGVAQFQVGGLLIDTASALTLPAGRALAENQSVVVWALASDLQTTGTGDPHLDARVVRIRERSGARAPAYVGGVVSNLVLDSFELAGVVVHSNGAQITGGALAAGLYVQVRGDFAADGSLTATRIKVRDGLPDAELRGTVIGYDPTAHTFKVRDVPVVSSALLDASCTGGLSEGQFVEVKGRLSFTGVIAESIKCTDAPAGAIIERRGVASNVAPLVNTFTLTTSTGAVTVRWTILTFFRDVTRGSLESAPGLRVEGVLNSNGVLVATKIRLDN